MTVVCSFAALAALVVGFVLGRCLRRRHDVKADPLLAEAEHEVEVLLGMGERTEQCLVTLDKCDPVKRVRTSCRFSKEQVEAVVALIADGVPAGSIPSMLLAELAVPTGKRPARWHFYDGYYCSRSGKKCRGPDGKWGKYASKGIALSPTTWALILRVIATRPRPEYDWLFQVNNGERPTKADVLLCLGRDNDFDDKMREALDAIAPEQGAPAAATGK